MSTALRHDLVIAGGGTVFIAIVLIAVGRMLQNSGAGPLVTRKIPHALCGLFAAAAAFQLSSGAVVAAVLAAATVTLAVIVERGLVPVPGVFDGTRARDYGLVTFAGGALVAVLAFWPDRAAIAGGMLVLGLADAGAALAGARFGRHRVAVSGAVRSLEGSAVFVAVAFTVALAFCLAGFGMSVPAALAVSAFVAVTTAAVELLVTPAADNLLITPWVALLLHIAGDLSPGDVRRWLVALVFGAAIVPFMYRMRWLDLPGAICGGLVAAVAVGLGGWAWIIPAALFFSVTSVLTGYRRPKQSRGLRGFGQVAVNAGLPVLVPVIGYAATGHPGWFAASIGGVAAGIADSWASEIGRFSARDPLSLRTFRRVTRGTSGAVSPLGSAATVVGALAVGGFGALFAGPSMVAVGLVAGVAGSLSDTVIGATVQGRFRCAACGAAVEERTHCGVAAERVSGWRWMDNNAVNVCANVVGMTMGVAVLAISAR